MKTKKRLLTAAALTLAAVVLVVATVFTTVAYLTASSAVSNTFTVGKVFIAMYESKVDADGKKLADDANINGAKKDSDGNNYHLLPGATYDKDPTIYVDNTSDKSYLFVKIRNNIHSIEKGNFVHPGESTATLDPLKPTIREQMAAYGWQFYLTTATGDVFVYVGSVGTGEGLQNGTLLKDDALKAVQEGKAKASPVGGNKLTQEFNLFDTFTIDEHADVSVYGGAKVTLTAFAIQTAGFTDNPETTDKDEALDAAWAAIVETYPYEDGAAVEP